MNPHEIERHRAESFRAFTAYQRTGRTAALDAAVSHGEALIGAGRFDVTDEHNLVQALLGRWDALGLRSDLDRAAAIALPQARQDDSGASHRSALLPAIGQVLAARGTADRSEADLVTAVDCYRQALRQADDEVAPLIKRNLSGALQALWNLRSSDCDLLEAVGILAELDHEATEPRQRLAIVQGVVAVTLDLHQITGLDGDWDGLIAELSLAIEAVDGGGPDLADSWANLALLHHLCYIQRSERSSIEKAVEAAQRAVEHAEGRSATHAGRLHVLACAERSLAASAQDIERLADAERHVRQAIEVAGETDWPKYTDTLASILVLRSELEHNPDTRGEALQASRRVAIEHPESAASLAAALRWAAMCAKDGEWNEGMRAFELAATHAERWFRNLGWLGSRVSWLEDRGRWSSAAAVTAARAGEPGKAVEMLERVRGMLLGGSRSDRSVASAQNAPTTDPVVYLCSSRFGGAAFVVTAGTVRAIDVPGLTVDESPNNVRARLSEYFDAYDDARSGIGVKRWTEVLDELTNWAGEEVMAAVLDTMGPADEAYVVPAGPLTFIPWHAAWVTDGRAPTGRSYVIDQVGLSFVPTMTSLAGSVPPVPGPVPIAVCEPRPVTGLRPLPTATLEVDGVRAALPSVREIAGEECTRDAVLRELRSATMAHLACHAVAPPWAPLGSHLVMSNDEAITVSDLIEERGGLGLAVLSACETGIGGRLLADEALTLANAMLVSGGQAAIGSLWIAPDAPTTAVMIRFYELWATEGLTARQALRASERWLRDTETEEIVGHFSDRFTGERLQLLRDGLSHPDLPRSHPAAWAPFVYSGA